MSEQQRKTELLDEVSDGYTVFETFLSELSPRHMLVSNVNGAWSIKDTIAHLTAWQERLLEWLQAASQNRLPANGPHVLDDATLDQINEQFYQEGKALPLDVVLQRFRTSSIQIIAAVERLSDEELTNPQRFAWLEGRPLWEVVENNTYGHYQEHMPPLRAWLEKVSGEELLGSLEE